MTEPTVTVRDDGTLQLTQDGQILPPLSLAAARLIAASIAAAEIAAARATLTAVARDLTGLMAVSPDLAATLTVTGTELTAYVDPLSFQIIQQVWQSAPDADGAIRRGPATVHLAAPADG